MLLFPKLADITLTCQDIYLQGVLLHSGSAHLGKRKIWGPAVALFVTTPLLHTLPSVPIHRESKDAIFRAQTKNELLARGIQA